MAFADIALVDNGSGVFDINLGAGGGGGGNIKSVSGVLFASIKSISGIAIASVKSAGGVTA